MPETRVEDCEGDRQPRPFPRVIAHYSFVPHPADINVRVAGAVGAEPNDDGRPIATVDVAERRIPSRETFFARVASYPTRTMADPIRYDHILVPTDGSEPAMAATDHALSLAGLHDAVVHAVYVVDNRITMAAAADTREDLEDTLREEGTAAVEQVTERAADRDVDVRTAIAHGTPSKEILEYVDDHEIDVVVMGSAGKTPREKLMRMGSVSERVVEAGLVPVLVVPD